MTDSPEDSTENRKNIHVKTYTTDDQGQRIIKHHETGPGRDDRIATENVERDAVRQMEKEREQARQERSRS